MIKQYFFTGLLIGIASLSSAVADTQIHSSYYSSKKATPQTAIIMMKDGKVALQDANGTTNGFYDSGLDVVFAVDHTSKSYYEIDRTLATKVGQQLNSVMTTMNQQMEKAMAGMTEAQKQQFKAMMPDVITRKPAPKPAQVSIRKTSKTNKVAGVGCEIAEILEAQKPVHKLCIASSRAAGVSDQEMQALKKLGQFAGELASLMNIGGQLQSQINPASIASAFNQMQGIPMAMNSRDGHSGHITAIKHDSVNNTVFSIPKGYQKKDVMGLLRGMGR